MKPLDTATIPPPALEQPAELVMETVSMVMRAIKREMRKARPGEMSMQQFSALGVVEHHPGASLSAVARRLGLTTASASKLIDALVRSRLVTRTDSAEDRRKVVLNVTRAGKRALGTARKAALGRLAEILGALDEPDRLTVMRAMDTLRRAMTDSG
jgi:DNA-binding MarR family transcriptional regulator